MANEENRIVTEMLNAAMDSEIWAFPDPEWEYYEILNRCQETKKSITKLLRFISAIEQPTPETDKSIREYLDQIGQHLNTTRRLLDS